MDKLKEILKSSKPTAAIVKQKDLISQKQKKMAILQEQEKLAIQQKKQQRLQQLEQFYQFQSMRKRVKTNNTQQIQLTPQQITTRLRQLHQPITFFAETLTEKYKRLLKIEEFYKKNPDFDMKTYDQQHQEKLKEQQIFNQLDAKYRDRLIEPRLGDDPSYLTRKMQMIVKEGDSVPFDIMCDSIYLWVIKILRDWNRALEQKYSIQAREKHQQSWQRFQMSSNQIKSFLVVLQSRGGHKDMIRAVYHVMNCCLVREYIQANDKYLQLSIGKAPWPMGIAMLSITVRYNSPKVSHVLDQEMPRRWMQSLKRLISVCQELYPNEDFDKKVGYSVNSMI